jgi:PadR family transcriptional regulator, regulatory protein PadR
MDITKDLVAASATPLVLAVLRNGDSYGYEIIQRIRELSDGDLEWNEGMLYPLLHRLADQKLIEAYQAKSPAGRTRKYYRLLPGGKTHFEKHREGFALVTAMLSTLDRMRQGGTHAPA